MVRPLPILLLCAFFGTVLFGDRQFGYRDGAHYYPPLYRYVQEELAAGRLPLWNPYENIGQPLAANPTAALFYPGKLIFFLPLDFTTLYGWFVVGHVLLAAFLAFRLAKAWRCSDEAATLAGVCYAFGGNVLFQHANVPFLIGAAWFPETLLQADRMFRLKSYKNAVLWGAVLAMMILGGDPQAAYHAILCAVLLLVVIKSRGRNKSRGRKPPADPTRQKTFLGRAAHPGAYAPGSCVLILGLLVMFLLAAVQMLPAWELSRHSDRVLPTHSGTIYLFSVPIWRLVEFFWPNAGGVEFPINARWFHGDDVWVPSFYMGLVPMFLAVWSLRFTLQEPKAQEPGASAPGVAAPGKTQPLRGLTPPALARIQPKRDVFLTVTLIVFVLGSLGQWGGVYPLLNFLPGYGMFRFPAKLLTVAALPIAILAARGFDRLFNDPTRGESFVRRFSAGVLLLSYGIVFAFNRTEIFVPELSLFGRFRYDVAHRFVVASFVHAVIVLLAFRILWIVFTKNGAGPMEQEKEPGTESVLRRSLRVILLGIIAFDLFFANAWMVAAVPRSVFQETATAVRSVLKDIHEPRIYRFPAWYPLYFYGESSKDRLAEIVRWERATLSPKYSLLERVGVVDVLGTMYPKDFYAVAGGLRWEIEHGEPGDLEKRLENLGVQYVLVPWGRELDAERIPWELPVSANVWLWKLRHPRPRHYAVFEPNRLEMDVDLAESGTVTVPEQFFPGWRAFADGKEYPIRPVEKIFRGVDLPAGKHRLVMIYDPASLKIGGCLSISGLLVCFVVFFGPSLRNKTGRRSVSVK